jgi:hypothetical protein
MMAQAQCGCSTGSASGVGGCSRLQLPWRCCCWWWCCWVVIKHLFAVHAFLTTAAAEGAGPSFLNSPGAPCLRCH